MSIFNLRKRNNKKKSNEKQRQQREKKKQVKNVSNIKDYIHDFLPIETVEDGVIKLKNGDFVRVLEIEPINFHLLEIEERYMIISEYSNIFNMPDVNNIQLKVITEHADATRYIELLMKTTQDEKSEALHLMVKNYIELIRDLGAEEALTKRFFIMFTYEPSVNISDVKLTYSETISRIHTTAHSMANYFSAAGNNVIPESLDPALATDHTIEFLYKLLNKRSSNHETIEERYKTIAEHKRRDLGIKDKNAYINVEPINLITPRGISFSHYKYTVIDGLYQTYLFVKGDSIPENIYPGWIESLINFGTMVDVDIHMKKLPKAETQKDVRNKSADSLINLSKSAENQKDAFDIENARQSTEYISYMLANNNALELYDIGIVFTLTARTLKELVTLTTYLTNKLTTIGLDVMETAFQQKNGFRATLPILDFAEVLRKQAGRNILSLTLATLSYVYTAYEISDEEGILLGVNADNSSLCIVDIFNSRKYKNANMVLIGTTGAGKTFTMSLIAMRLRMRGIQIFILAPIKGGEFRKACNAMGGEFIKIGPSSDQNINLMEIRPLSDESLWVREHIDGFEDGEIESYVTSRAQQIKIFFSLIMKRELDTEEEAVLDRAIVKTYNDFGITSDNDSVYVDKANGDLRVKEMPTLKELYHNIDVSLLEGLDVGGGEVDSSVIRVLKLSLNPIVEGTGRNLSTPTNVSLDNKYTVVDISTTAVNDGLLSVRMFIALDYIYSVAKEDRTKKKAIFIDEVWTLINNNEVAANYVLDIFKIIRGYGGAAIAATQNLNDFYALEDGKYGKGIINNSKTKIILNLEETEARAVQNDMNLTDLERHKIEKANTGEAILITNNNKVPIKVVPSEHEKNLISTDNITLNKQLQEKKAEEEKRKEEVIFETKERVIQSADELKEAEKLFEDFFG